MKYPKEKIFLSYQAMAFPKKIGKIIMVKNCGRVA
jgi:hypothetical protein